MVTSLPESQQPAAPSFREHLRALPSLVGEAPGFDPSVRPATPQALFREWFLAAENAGVPEPHAMTVSTVDTHGLPDARVLVLKDLTDDGLWCFAGARDSTKGLELTDRPVAALTFYWRELLRSIRLRGTITESSRAIAARDFSARSLNARAIAISGRQSTDLDNPAGLKQEIAAAERRISSQPDLVPEEWKVWQLRPLAAEFWEGSTDRLHTRLRYQRTDDGWQVVQLRP